KAAVVNVGLLKAGSSFNIVADKAHLEGTVRTFHESVREIVKERIYHIVDGITSAYGASYSIDYVKGYPALYNHPEDTETVRRLMIEQFSEENVWDMIPTMAAEDFSYFLLEKPGTYFRVGSQTD